MTTYFNFSVGFLSGLSQTLPLHLLRWSIIWHLFLALLIQCITFIHLHTFNHPCDESHLVLVYNLHGLHAICQDIFEDFCIYPHQGEWPVESCVFSTFSTFFWNFLSLWYQGNICLQQWIWEYVFLFNFIKQFEKENH